MPPTRMTPSASVASGGDSVEIIRLIVALVPGALYKPHDGRGMRDVELLA